MRVNVTQCDMRTPVDTSSYVTTGSSAAARFQDPDQTSPCRRKRIGTDRFLLPIMIMRAAPQRHQGIFKDVSGLAGQA